MEILIPKRGGRWAGGGKIRLMEILISRRGRWKGRWKDPSWGFSYSQERRLLGWRWTDPSHRNSYCQERRSLGWRWKDLCWGFSFSQGGGHWAGGGKIRFMEILIYRRPEVERSILSPRWKDPSHGNSYSQERRSLGWRWKDP